MKYIFPTAAASAALYQAFCLATSSPFTVQVGNDVLYSGLYYNRVTTAGELKANGVSVKQDNDKPAEGYEYLEDAYKNRTDNNPEAPASIRPPSAPRPAAKPVGDDETDIYKVPPLGANQIEELIQLIQWGNKTSTPMLDGLNNLAPPLQRDLLNLARDFRNKTGRLLTINCAWRNKEDQKQLKAKLTDRAVGGIHSSPHRHGLALDITSRDVAVADRLGLLSKHNMFVPIELTGESWHVESTYNVARYNKESQDFLTSMAEKGLNGKQIWAQAVITGRLNPSGRYREIIAAARGWAKEKAIDPNEAVSTAMFMYYTETSGGADLTSDTQIVGHFQISNAMRKKLRLKNPLSVTLSTRAALELAYLNGWESYATKNFAKHNLGLTTFRKVKSFIKKGTPLDAPSKVILLTNLPKSSVKRGMSDADIVEAYNKHVLAKADAFSSNSKSLQL